MKHAKYYRQLKRFGVLDKTWAAGREDRPVQNHSIPPALVKLREIIRPCEFECGQDVANQVIEYRRLGIKQRVWVRKCQTCGLYQDPVSLEMVDHRSLNKWFPPRNNSDSEPEE